VPWIWGQGDQVTARSAAAPSAFSASVRDAAEAILSAAGLEGLDDAEIEALCARFGVAPRPRRQVTYRDVYLLQYVLPGISLITQVRNRSTTPAPTLTLSRPRRRSDLTARQRPRGAPPSAAPSTRRTPMAFGASTP
jgi:hypothetical protein